MENALKDKCAIVIRNPWGDFDILDGDGTKTEIKCCSYIQDWDQSDYSKINFSGLKANQIYWSEAVQAYKEMSTESTYKADIYILALLRHKDHATFNILDLNQWIFYILTRDEIAAVTNNGNSVSSDKLEKNGFYGVPFAAVRRYVDQIKS